MAGPTFAYFHHLFQVTLIHSKMCRWQLNEHLREGEYSVSVRYPNGSGKPVRHFKLVSFSQRQRQRQAQSAEKTQCTMCRLLKKILQVVSDGIRLKRSLLKYGKIHLFSS